MTMVISYLSGTDGIMIADSRASYGSQEVPHDALQKIVSLGGNDVLGYAIEPPCDPSANYSELKILAHFTEPMESYQI